MSISRRSLFGLIAGLPLVGIGADVAKSAAACAEVVLEPRKIKMNTFSVAGFQYYQGWEIIHDIREGETVALVPEPDNPHDWYAVEMFKDGVKLGYVPRTDNKHISRLLGNNVDLHCEILNVNPASHSWNAVMVNVFLMHR